MNNKSKRQAIIKNIAIIFLAVMLVLTFFSNTILNWSLPEVASQYPQYGSIVSKVRTTATVKANSLTKIQIEETRKIKGVSVMEGQNVKVGDVLFYLEDAESEELKSAKETLASLEKQLAMKGLTAENDYYSDEKAIEQKKKSLAEAKRKLAIAGGDGSELDAANKELDSLQAAKKALDKKITGLNTELSKIKSQTPGVITTREKYITTKLEEAIAALNDGRSVSAEQVIKDKSLSEYLAKKAEFIAAEADVEEKTETNKQAQKEYNELSSELQKLGITDYDSLLDEYNSLVKTIKRYEEDYALKIDGKKEAVTEAYDAYVDADYKFTYEHERASGWDGYLEQLYQKRESLYDAYISLKDSTDEFLETEKRTYDRQMEDYNEKKAKLENMLGDTNLKDRLETAEKKADEAAAALETARENYSELQSLLTDAETEFSSSLADVYDAVLAFLSDDSDKLSEEITDKNREIEELKADNVDPEEQAKVVESLTSELEALEHSLKRRKEEDALAQKRDELDLAELRESIEKQKALVKKYQENSKDAKIVATVDGQIENLNAAVGQSTSVGQTLCEIVVTELGYSCKVNLTNEQARRVRVGDTVEVTNAWWSNITATVVGINNDPSNPGNAKIAKISLKGDVVVGQSLNLTIGSSGQNYDGIVPNTAVREDNNGKFVLVVDSKSTPLGNRYKARRVDISVVASDDTNSAVNGLSGGEFVIVTSTKPISSGSQIRLVEK